MNALPRWIDREAWDGFVEMRRRQEQKSRGKITWTSRAEKLILAELYKLKDKGHDPNAALDQSALKGWTDVYAPKDKEIPDVNPKQAYEPDRMTPEEWEKSREARERIQGMLKSVIRRVA